MDIETFRNYCLRKRGSSESFPFDENVLVFKVLHKMFAATNIESDQLIVNLKCNPERAIKLRELHSDITPGFHMNKKHWNSVVCENELQDDLICELIDHSYELVVKGMSKADQAALMS